MSHSIVLLCIVIAVVSSCQSPKHADLVIRGATVWTGDTENPTASALAVTGESIVYVGDDEGADHLIGDDTRVIDGTGKMVTPGFIDSHVHFLTGGFRLSSVQLRDADTKQEFVNRIAEFAESVDPGTWIVGGDWDHSLWGGDLPDREWVDSVTPSNPIWLNRLDGHMALANTAALTAAGIGNDVDDLEGGSIERDESGRITGLFRDNAMSLIDRVLPEPATELQDRALGAAMDYVAAQGVTSVHDMSGWNISYDALSRAHSLGQLRTRVYLAHPIWKWTDVKKMIDESGRGDEWLKIGALKAFVDGSLGSHTAAFYEPYLDSPADSGFFVVDMDELGEVAADADSSGLQLMIHAIGDRAIAELVDMFANIELRNGPADRRFRIEHTQHIRQADIARMASQNIIASMQPYHAIDDGRWADSFIGDRVSTTYAFRSLLDGGVRVAFGSDWFVAPPTPLEGIYAAVTRRTLDGANPNGWVPAQKITVEEALRAYTVDAAYAGFDEGIKGMIRPGMLADLVILSDDLSSIPNADIADVVVENTFVGGREIYSIEN
ncbi:MAG: amidohydrolase [Rhodothermales bacterium]|nr:amidohydrolase [Rhodothermales bacterium]